MRLTSLTFENFRGFEKFALTFPTAGPTVLVGRNGSGKSTVVDGIAIALGGWLSGFRDVAAADLRPIVKEDARLVGFERCWPIDVSATALFGRREVLWSRSLANVRSRTKTQGKDLFAAAANAEKHITEASTTLPLVADYATGRLWLSKRKGRTFEKGPLSRTAGYLAALESANDTHRFSDWLRRESSGMEGGVVPESLRGLARPLSALFERDVGTYWTAVFEEPTLVLPNERSKPVAVPISHLSDGQRSLFLLATDLFWRAYTLNPHFGEDAAAQTPGVVLIDELDLHLHPAWQATVLANLQEAFPKLQFIVTTHAPILIAAAPAGSVIELDPKLPNGWRPLPHLHGQDANGVLDRLDVPARPEATRQAIDALTEAIDAGNFAEARGRLAALATQLGENDAAVVAARWDLKFAEGDGDADATKDEA
jgi:predicted ATP-binding protein involved in virulence